MGFLTDIIHSVTHMIAQAVEVEAKSLSRIIKSLCCWCAGLVVAILMMFLGIIFIACGASTLLEPAMGRGLATVVVGVVIMLIGLVVMGFASACSKK
jgi:uncharacterized membrane protein HdeD (DUF308 family)